MPLFIKKYSDGLFTSKYIVPDFKGRLILSGNRGFGLSLGSTVPGDIILFAAGTGLYPFSDLIDLLFKSLLVK